MSVLTPSWHRSTGRNLPSHSPCLSVRPSCLFGSPSFPASLSCLPLPGLLFLPAFCAFSYTLFTYLFGLPSYLPVCFVLSSSYIRFRLFVPLVVLPSIFCFSSACLSPCLLFSAYMPASPLLAPQLRLAHILTLPHFSYRSYPTPHLDLASISSYVFHSPLLVSSPRLAHVSRISSSRTCFIPPGPTHLSYTSSTLHHFTYLSHTTSLTHLTHITTIHWHIRLTCLTRPTLFTWVLCIVGGDKNRSSREPDSLRE